MEPKIKLNSPAAIADFVMRDAGDSIVFVGPTLDYPGLGGAFVICTADADSQLRVDLILTPVEAGGRRPRAQCQAPACRQPRRGQRLPARAIGRVVLAGAEGRRAASQRRR